MAGRSAFRVLAGFFAFGVHRRAWVGCVGGLGWRGVTLVGVIALVRWCRVVLDFGRFVRVALSFCWSCLSALRAVVGFGVGNGLVGGRRRVGRIGRLDARCFAFVGVVALVGRRRFLLELVQVVGSEVYPCRRRLSAFRADFGASCEKRVRPSFCLRPRGERGSADGTQRSQDDSDRHCGRGAGAAGVHGACLPVMRASTREEMRRISSTSRSSSRLFSIHSR